MKLQDWRKAKGLSQVKAAEALGVNQAAWSRYENGLQVPGARILANIQRMTDGQVTAVDFVPPEDAGPVEA